jgi:hypothetical protein
MMVINDSDCVCKGAVVDSFEVLSQHLYGETEETQEIPQDIRCPGRLLSTIIIASDNFLGICPQHLSLVSALREIHD